MLARCCHSGFFCKRICGVKVHLAPFSRKADRFCLGQKSCNIFPVYKPTLQFLPINRSTIYELIQEELDEMGLSKQAFLLEHIFDFKWESEEGGRSFGTIGNFMTDFETCWVDIYKPYRSKSVSLI